MPDVESTASTLSAGCPMYARSPLADHATALPPICPVVHSSPSTISTCLGCPTFVPKSPFTPTSAPAAALIALVYPHMG
jgi:hypothetical protein